MTSSGTSQQTEFIKKGTQKKHSNLDFVLIAYLMTQTHDSQAMKLKSVNCLDTHTLWKYIIK